MLVPDYRCLDLYFTVSTFTSYFSDVTPQEARKSCAQCHLNHTSVSPAALFPNLLHFWFSFPPAFWMLNEKKTEQYCNLPRDTEWKHCHSTVSPPHFLSFDSHSSLTQFNFSISPQIIFLLCSFSFPHPFFHSPCLSHVRHSAHCGELCIRRFALPVSNLYISTPQ